MKLSIIIPIYNVEKYIRECLESIYSQKADNNDFEVICVDDCGKDESINLVKKYVQEFTIKNCITIHHDKNLGLSGARNTGANIAKGKYIMFLDSDDLLIENMLRKIIQIIRCGKYDLIEFNCRERVESESQIYLSTISDLTEIESDNGDEYLHKKMSLNEYYPMAVTKIVRKEVFVMSGMFTEGIYFEDEDYTPRLYLNCKKCVTYNIPIYLYRRRDGSITTTAFNTVKWIESYCAIIKKLLELYNSSATNISKTDLYDRICLMIVSIIKNCVYYSVNTEIKATALSAVKTYHLAKYPAKSKKISIRIQGYFMRYPNLFIGICKIVYGIKKSRKLI